MRTCRPSATLRAIIESMPAGGFDPNLKDHNGVMALHRCATAGRVEAVRALLAGGASINAEDGMFSGTLLLWASHGWRDNPQTGVDYLGMPRQFIERIPPAKAPDPEATQEESGGLCRAAAVS